MTGKNKQKIKPPDPPIAATPGVTAQPSTTPAEEASAQHVPPQGEDLQIQFSNLSLQNADLLRECARQEKWRDEKTVEHADELRRLNKTIAEKDRFLAQSAAQMKQHKEKSASEKLDLQKQLKTRQEELEVSNANVAAKSKQVTELETKAAQADDSMNLREDTVRKQIATVRRFINFLGSLEFSDEGVKGFRAKVEPKVDSEPKVEKPKGPHVPIYNVSQAAQIYKEGRNMGYLEYAKDADLADALSGLYPEEFKAFDKAAAPTHTRDTEHARHPYNRGREIGYTAGGAVMADAHKHKPFDKRLWQQHALKADSVASYSEIVPPPPGSFWAGFGVGIDVRLDELEPEIRKLGEDRLAAKKAVGNA
jgi:hypothetical protein